MAETEAPATAPTSAPTPTTPAASESAAPTPVQPSQVSGETSDDRPQAQYDFTGVSLDYQDEVEVPAETATGQGQQVAQEQKEPVQADKAPPAGSQQPAPSIPQVQVPPPTQAPQQQAAQDKQASPGSQPTSVQDAMRGLENPETAKALKGWLAQNMYSLSEEEKTALDTDAVAAIPSLLSRVHFESAKNAMNLIQSLVPQMVQEGVRTALDGQNRASAAMQEFFAAWPGLNQRDHGQLVDQFARMYRASNPKASRQDAIKFVGAAIHAQLGLVPQAKAPNGNGVVPAPRGQPFAPARPGARPPTSTVVEESPWAGLGQNFDDD